MENPKKRIKWPWWIWLIIILFPIPIGRGPWWLTVGFIVLFVLVVWAITMHYKNKSSE